MKKYEVTINGQVYLVELKEISDEAFIEQEETAKSSKKMITKNDETPVPAPMAGKVLSIAVKVGEKVRKGDTLCVLEAMKMETAVVAPKDSIVSSIDVSKNQSVESNQLLMVI